MSLFRKFWAMGARRTMQQEVVKKINSKKMKVIPGGGQMSLIRDTEEVIKFLEFAGRKNILNDHAVNNRLTACHNLFSVLNEEEDNLDYILSNLDVLVNRFRNKNNNVRASTLKVYKSRTKSSVQDFKAWSADPFAWERQVTEKVKSAGLESRKERRQARKAVPRKAARKTTSAAPRKAKEVHRDAGEARTVTMPIREDFSIEIELPPNGISLKELNRIGMFLYPYCNDLDDEHVRWPSLLN